MSVYSVCIFSVILCGDVTVTVTTVRAVSCSFALLWGPCNHLKHLLSAERLPFTVTYFGTMGATLYFALSVSTLFYLHNVHHELHSAVFLHTYNFAESCFDIADCTRFLLEALDLNIKI